MAVADPRDRGRRVASLTVADKKNINDDFSPALTDYPNDPSNIEAEYGRSRADERYRFVASGVFRLPLDTHGAPEEEKVLDFGGEGRWRLTPRGIFALDLPSGHPPAIRFYDRVSTTALNAYVGGYITWTGDKGHVVRIPVVIRPVPAS